MGNGSRQGTMRMGVEEHESVMEEPSGQHLGHFTPGPPSTGWSIQHEKPALKVAQGIVKLLQKHDSLGVSHGSGWGLNTLERRISKVDRGAVGTRVFRAICKLRTNELLLRHLMADLDGPASSKEMNVLHVGKTTYLDGRGSW